MLKQLHFIHYNLYGRQFGDEDGILKVLRAGSRLLILWFTQGHWEDMKYLREEMGQRMDRYVKRNGIFKRRNEPNDGQVYRPHGRFMGRHWLSSLFGPITTPIGPGKKTAGYDFDTGSQIKQAPSAIGQS